MEPIPFNVPALTGGELKHIEAAIARGKLCGDGEYGKRCQEWFESKAAIAKTLLTPSCTHALEMAAILLDIQPGDEVIMPSFTFVSTANAFVMRGAQIVFVDIRPDTMNIDESLVDAAITERTKAIVPVHYAGVSCEMNEINNIANRNGVFVVEDAAQAVMSKYHDHSLGSIGHLAAFSFHETKNITSGGEGGLLAINDRRLVERAEVIREKGTNRRLFIQGMVDKYTWVDIGSSYLPSELQAAYLWAQLEKIEDVISARKFIWAEYASGLLDLALAGRIQIPEIPAHCICNAHIFYIKCKDLIERSLLIEYLKNRGIQSAFHYIPLHSAPAARKFGRFHGVDVHTTTESERLLRLPIWYGMSHEECQRTISAIRDFYV